MADTKLDSGTQAKAEAIVAEALARHGHVARDPGRHLGPQLVTAPMRPRAGWPRQSADALQTAPTMVETA